MKDALVGETVRPTPSGHIHLVEHVSHVDYSGPARADLLILACGQETRRDWVTTEFPPGGRRCSRCFPPDKEADGG